MNKRQTIIPIASGKGGVGKSLLTANLAIALARAGHSTVAVDLDLGGSNLHTYLGMSNSNPGIGDFLKGRRIKFDRLLVETDIENLRFLPGDGKTPFMANIPFNQRLLLIEELQRIPAEFILLDLGAGTTFNTLNFFGLTHRGAIVTTFETPAILNFLVFLRNFIFRVLSSLVRDDRQLFTELLASFRRPISNVPLTVTALLEMIARHDPQLADQVVVRLRQYRPRIFFNMGESPDELQVTTKISNTLRQTLMLEADFFGFIFFDDTVRHAAKTGEVLLVDHPLSPAARSIDHLAHRIARNWHFDFNDSAILLSQDTKEKFSAWKSG